MVLWNLLIRHWSDILLALAGFFLAIIRVWSPELAGLNKTYFDPQGIEQTQRKMSFLEILMSNLSHVILMPFTISFTLRGTVTVILFLGIGLDIFLTKKISDNAVKIAIVGIVALYLERLIETADEISIWKIFTWKSKKLPVTTTTPAVVASEEPIPVSQAD